MSERLYDVDVYPGHFIPSVASGALPGGGALYDGKWYSEYQANPTTVGSFDFTLQLATSAGETVHLACHVDVNDELSLPAGIDVLRVSAEDRYAESAAISRILPGVGGTVYIASGEVFADALSSSAIAAQRGAPVLLTRANAIPEVVKTELVRLRPSKIVIVGGPDTIQPVVETQLGSYALTVTRIGGADRYEVARNLIADSAAPSSTAYIASGNVFPDALGSAAAAGNVKAPVALVDGAESSLTAEEVAMLSGRSVTRAIIVGGSATISSNVENDLRTRIPQVKRIGGADRYEASAAVARDSFPSNGSALPDTVYLATGEKYPDALTGAVLAAQKHSPVYLVHPDCIPRDAARHILDIGATHVVLLGGSETLTDDVANLTVCAS
ncbi:cell wall-binding repeat-containing protein [Herbiconiux sp. 11R-BC]|uniref:cell wall-binding repeat-containing protein n=1 Tax=Herbiconiux sp. 11R-BC TaxID=3111637 RepID=UPI003C01A72B